MKKLGAIILAAVLMMSMCLVSAVSVMAVDSEYVLNLGTNTISPANGDAYVFTAPAAGVYTITVEGADSYSIGKLNENVVELFEYDPISVRFFGDYRDVVVTIVEGGELPGPDAVDVYVGENPDIAVSGDEGVILSVIPEGAGRYTVTTDNANILVGVHTATVDDFDLNYIDFSPADRQMFFVLVSEDFSNDVANVTVTRTDIPASDGEEAVSLQLGENKDVRVSTESTLVMVTPEGAGTYTLEVSNPDVTVMIKNEDGSLEMGNSVVVETKATRQVFFYIYAEEATVTDITVVRTDLPEDKGEEAVSLQIGENKDVPASEEGTLVMVTPNGAGTYTLEVSNPDVTVMIRNEDGSLEKGNSVVVETKATRQLFFYIYAEENTVTDITVKFDPAVVTEEKNENKPTGDMALIAEIVVAVVAVTACAGVVISKKKVNG